MNNSGLSDQLLPRLGPRREPASLAPAPPPRWGASRRGRKRGALFAAEQATASRSRLARGPGGLGAGRRVLYYVVNFWDGTPVAQSSNCQIAAFPAGRGDAARPVQAPDTESDILTLGAARA